MAKLTPSAVQAFGKLKEKIKDLKEEYGEQRDDFEKLMRKEKRGIAIHAKRNKEGSQVLTKTYTPKDSDYVLEYCSYMVKDLDYKKLFMALLKRTDKKNWKEKFRVIQAKAKRVKRETIEVKPKIAIAKEKHHERKS